MKYKVVLCTIVVFSCILLSPLTVFADNQINADDVVSLVEPITSEDFGIAPEHLFPFVYRLDDDWSFFRDFVGTCECEPGYLYVKNLNTNEIIQVLDEPVRTFTETNELLFCVTNDNRIVVTDYDGGIYYTLYSGIFGSINSLEYYKEDLYFIDSEYVIRLNIADQSHVVLTVHDGISSLIPISENYLLLRTNSSENIVYNVSDMSKTSLYGENGVSDYIDSLCLQCSNSTESIIETNAVIGVVSNDVTFPLPGYEAGKYFSTRSTGCDHLNGVSYCKTYSGPGQCMGFAMFASDQFAHLSEPSNFRRPAGDTSSTSIMYDAFSNDTEVRSYFASLTRGAYVRLSADSEDEDTIDGGTHSLVYDRITSTGVQTYDANRDFKCGIRYDHRSFYEIRTKYKYMYEHVSHCYTNIASVHSATRHKYACANCEAYVTAEHEFVIGSDSKICNVCGYRAPLPEIMG